MSETDTCLHPRPQLRRERWIDLSGPWGFAYDDDNRGLHDGWVDRDDVYTRTIMVPYPPESPASGVGDTGFHPVVWYRRTFRVAPPDAGKRLLLHCGAVDYRAHVWINGKQVAEHEGGHTPFHADITPALLPTGEQTVVIRAEDMPTDLAQPRGKQDWQQTAHNIWYNRTTGIWQPVWLEPVPDVYLTATRWTPDLDRGTLSLRVWVNRSSLQPLRLRLRLSLHDVELVDDVYQVFGSELQRDVALDLGLLTMERERVLWSPGHPNLIQAELTLLCGDEAVDRAESYTALRSVGVAGGRFLLNQRPYYLRMALEQGFWPESYLAAPSPEALKREVELAKELGFNGVRIHQKVEDPRFLYWCDQLGLMVWGEMANSYVFSTTSVERFTREWIEVIARDYNHPCIVTWVPINESWGVPNLLQAQPQQDFVRAIYHLTRALDPTRPVIGNDGWEYLAGDILGIHDYSFDGETLRERYGTKQALERTLRDVQPGYRFVSLSGQELQDQPIVLSEFGGISYRPEAGARWFGYGTVTDQNAYQEKYRELVKAVLDCPPLSGFCYTQLTDTLQETNGLLTADRQFKVDPEVVRAINGGASGAVPGDLIAQMQRVQGTAFSGGPAEP